MVTLDQRSVAVIGAGTMGWQISLQLASHGVVVRIYDRDFDVLHAAEARMRQEGTRLASEGLLPASAAALGEVVQVAESLSDAVNGCWYVLEAVPERLEIKRALFGELSQLVPSDTILATNSSSFKSRHLVDVTAHPQRLMNNHFYNVPWKRSAVEIMSCGQTDPNLMSQVADFLRQCDLVPIVAQAESTGFIFNRVWHAVKRESLKVVAEGVATPEDVDRLWCLSMEADIGPFAMMDRVGLDVVLDIERHYAAESGNADDAPPQFLVDMVEHGELGRKTGRGFYSYPKPSWERPGWPRE